MCRRDIYTQQAFCKEYHGTTNLGNCKIDPCTLDGQLVKSSIVVRELNRSSAVPGHGKCSCCPHSQADGCPSYPRVAIEALASRSMQEMFPGAAGSLRSPCVLPREEEELPTFGSSGGSSGPLACGKIRQESQRAHSASQ